MNVFDVKKYPLGNFPTPLERMSNLEKYLGVPNLFIKRDDLNGLGLAGNQGAQAGVPGAGRDGPRLHRAFNLWRAADEPRPPDGGRGGEVRP